jgi:intracellular septation protein A
MSRVLSGRTLLLGLVSWFVPFATSFLFVGRDGQWLIPQPLFKSIMVVVFGGVGAGLLVITFRRIKPSLINGIAVGGLWLALNLGLDVLILVPMVSMDLALYWQDIGLRYVLIPIMAAAIGVAGQRPD